MAWTLQWRGKDHTCYSTSYVAFRRNKDEVWVEKISAPNKGKRYKINDQFELWLYAWEREEAVSDFYVTKAASLISDMNVSIIDLFRRHFS